MRPTQDTTDRENIKNHQHRHQCIGGIHNCRVHATPPSTCATFLGGGCTAHAWQELRRKADGFQVSKAKTYRGVVDAVDDAPDGVGPLEALLPNLSLEEGCRGRKVDKGGARLGNNKFVGRGSFHTSSPLSSLGLQNAFGKGSTVELCFHNIMGISASASLVCFLTPGAGSRVDG